MVIAPDINIAGSGGSAHFRLAIKRCEPRLLMRAHSDDPGLRFDRGKVHESRTMSGSSHGFDGHSANSGEVLRVFGLSPEWGILFRQGEASDDPHQTCLRGA